jgi:hypothetical protein
MIWLLPHPFPLSPVSKLDPQLRKRDYLPKVVGTATLLLLDTPKGKGR